MHMAEVRGQNRQVAFGVFAGAVPPQERHHGESVSQVVQTRPVTIGGTPEADLSRQRIEGSVDRAAI
jgi:hypothetical protein